MAGVIEPVHLRGEQLLEVAAVLARAFFDDPLLIYIEPDDDARLRILPWFMGTGARYGHLFGEVYTTGGKIEAGAVWLTPGNTEVAPERMRQAGMDEAPARLGEAAFGRFTKVMGHFASLHARNVAGEHWYLMILGVDPPRQGQGVGGALIQPVLARADVAGLPCYLETNKARNVPFYRRHGFEVVVDADLPGGGPHLWTMLRPPRTR